MEQQLRHGKLLVTEQVKESSIPLTRSGRSIRMGSMALNWHRFLLMSMMINRPRYFIYSVYGAGLMRIPVMIPLANLNGLLRVCGPSNPVNLRSLVMATGIPEDRRGQRDV